MAERLLLTFDLDNTLWPVDDVIPRAEQAMRDWLDAHCPTWQREGVAGLQRERLVVARECPQLLHDLSALRREVLRRLLGSCGLHGETLDAAVHEAFMAFFNERQRVQPYPGAVATVAALAREHTLIALSNGNADIFRTVLGDSFRGSISAEQAGQAKPHPRMFEMALAEAGPGHAGAIHIGDHPEQDIAAAQALGWPGIWVNHDDSRWPLTRAPDAVVTTLADLPAAIRQLREGR